MIGFISFVSGLPANAYTQSGVLEGLGIDIHFDPGGDTSNIIKDGHCGDTFNNCDTNTN